MRFITESKMLTSLSNASMHFYIACGMILHSLIYICQQSWSSVVLQVYFCQILGTKNSLYSGPGSPLKRPLSLASGVIFDLICNSMELHRFQETNNKSTQ